MANEQLNVSWPVRSWYKLHNENLMSVGKWEADVSWFMLTDLKCWFEVLIWNVDSKCWFDMLIWNVGQKCWFEMLMWNIIKVFNLIYVSFWNYVCLIASIDHFDLVYEILIMHLRLWETPFLSRSTEQGNGNECRRGRSWWWQLWRFLKPVFIINPIHVTGTVS